MSTGVLDSLPELLQPEHYEPQHCSLHAFLDKSFEGAEIGRTPVCWMALHPEAA